MKISEAFISIINDSRGKPTLAARLLTGEKEGYASVPSGKSRGAHEAIPLESLAAVRVFEKTLPELLGRSFVSQEEFDRFLIALDGTADKHILGANLILALSLAFARLQAQTQGIALHRYIRDISHSSSELVPHPFFNVINGGAHVAVPDDWKDGSGRVLRLDFQEFQIIPTTDDFLLGLSVGQEFYKKLEALLKNEFGEKVLVGDEAGFFCPFSSNEEALEIMRELIERQRYPLAIGLDVAASQMWDGKRYGVDGKKLSAADLLKCYQTLAGTYGIMSIEDPFYEEDFSGFSQAARLMPETIIITDDLTTTNGKRLGRAIGERAGNAILVKLNQIGTLTETLDVIKQAHAAGWKTVISHRSGETEDDFIADLAMGVGAWGLKSGAPATPYRMNKYNRVLEIVSENKSLH